MLGEVRVMPILVEGSREVWKRTGKKVLGVSNVLLLDQVMGQLMKIC